MKKVRATKEHFKVLWDMLDIGVIKVIVLKFKDGKLVSMGVE